MEYSVAVSMHEVAETKLSCRWSRPKGLRFGAAEWLLGGGRQCKNGDKDDNELQARRLAMDD